MSHCCGGGQQTVSLNVEGMSCGHCKASVEKAVSALDGVSKVDVDLAGKKVNITYAPEKVKPDAFKKAITGQGYEVV
ncbi:MAG: copper ion binding protein [Clostridia bacterium]|nr:copper ion binding protein [Clostridia bacterium]